MNNDVYKVERDDYAGVIKQLNPKTTHVETFHEEFGTIIKIKSEDNTIHFTTRIIPEDGEEEYYVFVLPYDEYAIPPKPVWKLNLETKEEVQAFFDTIAKLQKEKKDG